MAQTKLAVFPAVDTYSAPTTPHDSGWRTGSRRYDALRLLCLVALAFFCFSPSIHILPWRADDHGSPPLGLPKDVQRSWGQYSPYFPADTYQPPPIGCEITQVNILQRHGARFPNSDDTYGDSVKELLSAKKFNDGHLEFLRDYEYNLPEEELTSFGATQSFDSGEVAYKRYGHIISENDIPFVRASGKSRIIASATNWTVGFAAASRQRFNPFLNVIIPETQNNSLNENCPNAGDGAAQKDTWLSVFAPPIVQRLEKAAPGVKLSNGDVVNLLAMCPFETMAKKRPSGFCGLFTTKEFKQFEYHGDVDKYYKTGYGEPLGPVQGVGYVNELIARLTGRPVQDSTQHNSSLPFPLGRKLYADFTHENLMVGVFSVIGLFNSSSQPLSPKHMDETREWVASKMVPFSARLVVEKVVCHGAIGRGLQREYVRTLVNDAVQPLRFCGGGDTGMCALEAFVDSQNYAREGAGEDFKKCYN